ncbi:polysaccharide deacetylase family protein [Rhodococcus sp. IEGM 1318]|uniref:polysaccharide deacetylase family protein n=1 Tax=Rhodococcus sp. IEGM 1318 TaxID=3082226 RepID=UPI002952D0F8|nr:polysaccharide deacetylase family protein [Rhodococcus sp. IEGM 1318]MDV8009495.1 polysaccharide deacetylase family protein [Rhodococcus sp. IEGM 1318]
MSIEKLPYARDHVGYGEHPPQTPWPDGARIAVNFVLNYEEGAESTPLNGDAQSETYLHESPGSTALVRQRNVNVESMYDYGSRSGVWRILRIFERAQVPITVFAVGQALAANRDVGRAFATCGHEIASHHWRWIDYLGTDIRIERDDIQRAVDIIEKLTGKPPVGWYSGRGSINSRALAVEAGCFIYDSDVYDDDLPHWAPNPRESLLLVPYSLDTNDVKFALSPGFSTGIDFENHLRDTFDFLYEEGATVPKMMSIGLHCRMAGRPGRAAALTRFIRYIQSFDDVWICRREDIARHWIERHPRPDTER